jgi:hypothetical protein
MRGRGLKSRSDGDDSLFWLPALCVLGAVPMAGRLAFTEGSARERHLGTPAQPRSARPWCILTETGVGYRLAIQ